MPLIYQSTHESFQCVYTCMLLTGLSNGFNLRTLSFHQSVSKDISHIERTRPSRAESRAYEKVIKQKVRVLCVITGARLGGLKCFFLMHWPEGLDLPTEELSFTRHGLFIPTLIFCRSLQEVNVVDGDETVHCGPALSRQDLQNSFYTLFIMCIHLSIYMHRNPFLQFQPVLNVHSHEQYECQTSIAFRKPTVSIPKHLIH